MYIVSTSYCSSFPPCRRSGQIFYRLLLLLSLVFQFESRYLFFFRRISVTLAVLRLAFHRTAVPFQAVSKHLSAIQPLRFSGLSAPFSAMPSLFSAMPSLVRSLRVCSNAVYSPQFRAIPFQIRSSQIISIPSPFKTFRNFALPCLATSHLIMSSALLSFSQLLHFHASLSQSTLFLFHSRRIVAKADQNYQLRCISERFRIISNRNYA